MLEITEKEAPELFNLVREIAATLQTSFPGHIYLTPEVNASVFYDSSLASLLFPVKKNLQIGIGLVNAVTESEFKAILAHEFGHFSQRSMKVGSYVYHVNQIIYNLLYENDSYRSLLDRWTSISGYFSIFAQISIKVIQGIQWLMGKVYNLVNISYLGLSREMEFHADEMAAFVAGTTPMISGLMRLEFADVAYNNLIGFYDERITECQSSENIYPQHTIVMKQLAATFNIRIINGFPEITEETNKKFNRSRLIIKNQWASHPSVTDRIERIKQLSYTGKEVNSSAWNYFAAAEKYQGYMTQQLFQQVKYKERPEMLDVAKFTSLYDKSLHAYDLPSLFNGFYDSREISDFDVKNIPEIATTHTIEELFNEQCIDITYEYKGLSNDIVLLEEMLAGNIKVRQFDYDGYKYKPGQVPVLLEELKLNQHKIAQQMEETDRLSFAFFKDKVAYTAELEQKYEQYFEAKRQYDKDIALRDEIAAATAFVQVSMPYQQIIHNFEMLRPQEQLLKERIRAGLLHPEIADKLDKESLELLEKYLSRDWNYFKVDRYLDDGLKLLGNAIRSFYLISFCHIFYSKKKLLEYQAASLERDEKGMVA